MPFPIHILSHSVSLIIRTYSKKLLKLTQQLYPTGRAFKMPVDGNFEGLHKALTISEQQAIDDAKSILFDILPDTDGFTTDDATDWERRLGLITNPATALADRMAAIVVKLNQPGVNPAKQNFLYLQEQLQNAGFNVYVFENRFPNYPNGYITQTPEEVSGLSTFQYIIEHNDIEHGDAEHGTTYNNIIANNIIDAKDLGFDFGGDFRNTFFIGGNPVGTYANVPVARHDEFRQLILKFKPVQTIGFLFINYV